MMLIKAWRLLYNCTNQPQEVHHLCTYHTQLSRTLDHLLEAIY